MSKLFIKLALCSSVLALCSAVPTHAMEDRWDPSHTGLKKFKPMQAEIKQLIVNEESDLNVEDLDKTQHTIKLTDKVMNILARDYKKLNGILQSNPDHLFSITIESILVNNGQLQLSRNHLPHCLKNLMISDPDGLIKSTTDLCFSVYYSKLNRVYLSLPELTEIGQRFMPGDCKNVEEIQIEAPKLTNIKSELFKGLTGTTIKILPKTADIFRASLEGRFSEMGEQDGFVLLQLK